MVTKETTNVGCASAENTEKMPGRITMDENRSAADEINLVKENFDEILTDVSIWRRYFLHKAVIYRDLGEGMLRCTAFLDNMIKGVDNRTDDEQACALKKIYLKMRENDKKMADAALNDAKIYFEMADALYKEHKRRQAQKK